MELEFAVVPSGSSVESSVLKKKWIAAEISPAVTRLPAEVAEQILFSVDQETFASLILTSRLWRYAAESAQLYAYHLSRCPSFSATNDIITKPVHPDSLKQLKKRFIQEAKRNLYSVFTKPRKTIINLISTTTSSAGAFPFGEAFEFSFSPGGLWCLAKSSSRLIIINTAAEEPFVKRELKVVRKPLAAYILQDGSRLAVLSSSHKVNIYDLGAIPKLVKTVALDEEAHALALSLHGEVLAVAYDGGVEVTSLLDHALPTDKRAVKSDRVDTLSFSEDGTMLLGTTQSSKSASTVIISAPYFTETSEEIPQSEFICHMWTSQILFPYSSRDCSHAALLPRKMDHDANWTLTYDRVFESFRAVRTDDLRNGHTYFAGPKPNPRSETQNPKNVLTPSTLPAITENGELVAAGFLGNEIWLYGVPEDLDHHTISAANSPLQTRYVEPNSPIEVQVETAEIEHLPRWQVLVDKYRNVFAKGRRIAIVDNVTQMSWVSQSDSESVAPNLGERLVIGAPGGVSMGYELEQEEMASVDGGRLVMLDFAWSPHGGQTKEITIEIGLAEPEKLEEQNTDMATEIAIVRRRTVARRDGIPRSHVASVADVLRPADEPVPPVPPMPTSAGFGLDTPQPVTPEEPGTPVSPTHATLQEAANAFDGPYSHTNPRSRNTLYRSATAVEASRRRAPPLPPSTGVVQYRRTDGSEMPHESDADGWVPPPPPYSRDADIPLPDHLRQTLLPRQNQTPSSALGASFRRPLRSLATLEQMNFRRRSSADVDRLSHTSSSRHSIAAISLDHSDRSERGDMISPVSPNHPESPTSARAISPLASLRRPNSTYEPRSNRSSMYRAALRPPEPISTVTETVAEQPAVTEPEITPIRPRTFRSSSLTLAGPHLQDRLDYPLPPAPNKHVASTPSPTQQSPRHMHSQSDISGSTSLPLNSPPSASFVSPRTALAPVIEPVMIPHSIPRRPLTVVTTSTEPSAYSINSARFAPPLPPQPIPQVAEERTTRFRSPFRRNTQRAASQPHLRTVNAMGFQAQSASDRTSNARLNTIYNLNSSNTEPLPPAVPLDARNQTINRPNTQYERGSVQTHIYSNSPRGPQNTAVNPSRVSKHIPQFRGRSEEPGQMSMASQRDANEPDVQTGYIGRGRRRTRAGTNVEVWEGVFPQEMPPQTKPKVRKRDGGGRCVVM